jgi:hypothetical protein
LTPRRSLRGRRTRKGQCTKHRARRCGLVLRRRPPVPQPCARKNDPRLGASPQRRGPRLTTSVRSVTLVMRSDARDGHVAAEQGGPHAETTTLITRSTTRPAWDRSHASRRRPFFSSTDFQNPGGYACHRPCNSDSMTAKPPCQPAICGHCRSDALHGRRNFVRQISGAFTAMER